MIPYGTFDHFLDLRDWLVHQTGDGFFRLVSHDEELVTEGYWNPEDVINELSRQIEIPPDIHASWRNRYERYFASYEPPEG